jgi:hypothetical protein
MLAKFNQHNHPAIGIIYLSCSWIIRSPDPEVQAKHICIGVLPEKAPLSFDQRKVCKPLLSRVVTYRMIKFHPGTKRNIFLEKYRSKTKGALPASYKRKRP